MKMKQVMVTIPENCELKQDGNTYTIVEKEKKLTYEDVARKLFSQKGFYIGNAGTIESFKDTCYDGISYGNNCISQKQAEKLLAINKLMNVAKYLNGDWQPDWDSVREIKYYIYYSNQYKILKIYSTVGVQSNVIFFKSKKLAEQAIEILGEETIKLALCTDY